jgi:hypothetical protein
MQRKDNPSKKYCETLFVNQNKIGFEKEVVQNTIKH